MGLILAIGGAFLFAALLALAVWAATRKPGRHAGRHAAPRQDPAGPQAGVQAPPALHADESIAMTREAMAEGLAEQQLKEWGP